MVLVTGALAPSVVGRAGAALPALAAAANCQAIFDGVYTPASSEPLAACQWDMSLIEANDAAHAVATGKGVLVGDLDSGVDITHPDIAPNLDLGLSCSFIYSHDPTADPVEVANGDCSNKAAVQDVNGHGTHTASTIAAPINGIGIAGVAPEATIVAIKVCNVTGYCFADSVAGGLRYAADIGVDVVNMSLFADPYLYYCGNAAEQRAILRDLQAAARYAQQRGVLIVAAAGNEADDLAHPTVDVISPDWPSDAAYDRIVHNNCRVAPTELPGVLTVSATGPVGVPGYDLNIASYSDVGMGVVNVAAPGGDYFSATGTVQDAVLAAWTSTDDGFWDFYSTLPYPGLTATDAGARYIEINGTSMAAPHATGVAALVIQQHPGWGPGAVKAAVQRSATAMSCPPDWSPLFDGDLRLRCYGDDGTTSFFGHGMVDALQAALR
jgi:lantibiotic leader peptide-processing serine protease